METKQKPILKIPAKKSLSIGIKQRCGLICKSILLISLFWLFSIPLYSQTVIVISDLQFPDTVSTTSSQSIVVAPNDSGAAVFDATGLANQTVDVEIKEKSVQLGTPSGKKLKVDSFTFGGSLTPTAKGGAGTFDTNGDLFNMRIGATASVKNGQDSGFYSGTLTLQVTYQ